MFFDEARDAEGRGRREVHDREFAQKHLDAAKGNARADVCEGTKRCAVMPSGSTMKQCLRGFGRAGARSRVRGFGRVRVWQRARARLRLGILQMRRVAASLFAKRPCDGRPCPSLLRALDEIVRACAQMIRATRSRRRASLSLFARNLLPNLAGDAANAALNVKVLSRPSQD